MKNRFYDKDKKQVILKNRRINLDYAVTEMQSYLEKFPLDYRGYIEYIGLLIDLKRLDEAREIFELIEPGKPIFDDFKDNSKDRAMKYASYIYAVEKVRYYTLSRDFQKAYQLILETSELFNDMGLETNGILLFLEKKLGIENSRNDNFYLGKQITDYNVDRLKQHMDRHLETDSINSVLDASIFYEDFPLDEAITDLRILLPNEKSIYCFDILSEKYTFRYDSCGTNEGVTTDYFQVVTLLDSNDIITMYPFKYGAYYDYLDVNYLSEVNGRKRKKPKTKTRNRSRIDSFNKKYGNYNNK